MYNHPRKSTEQVRSANAVRYEEMDHDLLRRAVEEATSSTIDDAAYWNAISRLRRREPNEVWAFEAVDRMKRGLVFLNLVDFDMLYGHRRDPAGYYQALQEFDTYLPRFVEKLGPNDLLLITADHGNDPTFSGSDHTREYAPLLVYGKSARPGINLGTRGSLADIGQTVAENFGLKLTAGKSFLGEVSQAG